MKRIIIHSQNGLSPLMKKAAEDAAREFLEMFPEYKNSFTIEHRDDEHLTHKKISQAEYDALPDDNYKKLFVKTADGHWLVPYESMEWFVSQATEGPADKKIDADKLTRLRSDYLKEQNSSDIVINLVKEKFRTDTPKETLYGLTIGNCFSISAEACADEDLFKAIFIHESGHIFNATHSGRANIIEDAKKGVHCKNPSDPLCLMGDDNYDLLAQEYKQRRSLGKSPFCNDCIAAIRECMANMPDLTKEVITEEFSLSLPVEPHNDKEWKRDLRAFYQSVAQRDGFTYKEDRQAENYLAKVVRTDGSSLSIEANNEYHVALGATDKDGAEDTPSLKDMKDLVKYAQSKNSGMSFGKDNNPEFNARLMIACLEAKPSPLKMRNNPKVDDVFLNKLSLETRNHLKRALGTRQNVPIPYRGR